MLFLGHFTIFHTMELNFMKSQVLSFSHSYIITEIWENINAVYCPALTCTIFFLLYCLCLDVGKGGEKKIIMVEVVVCVCACVLEGVMHCDGISLS